LVAQHLLNEFKKKEGVDLSKDIFAIQRIREAAEQAKKDLDHVAQTEINLPFITPQKNFSFVLTRDTFNKLIKPLVDRTVRPCTDAMNDAGLKRVDTVILVGGMTRTPIVIEKAKEIFGQEPSKGVNPDEVVAVGAAIQGGVLSGSVTSLILLDVTPLSLGVDTKGDIFSRIIKRNSNIPCSNTQTYTTSEDGQKKVDFGVFQGEREIASKNHLLGRVSLPVMPTHKGIAKVNVTFSIDANGIVHVVAADPVTQKTTSVHLQASGGLSKEDINRMLKEAQFQKEHDQKVKETIEIRNKAEELILNTEAEYLNSSLIPDEDKQKLRQNLDELKQVLETSGNVKEKMDTLNEAILSVGQKLYQKGSSSSGPNNDGGKS